MRTNKFSINLSRAFLLLLATLLAGLAFSAPARGEFAPLWTSRVPAGTSLGSGTAGFHVDPDGISYVTGIVGSSSVNDIQTTSFEADGSTRWSVTYDSGKSGDQARGLARGPDNLLYVVGNTPGPNDFANVLVLVYDVTNGALLKTMGEEVRRFEIDLIRRALEQTGGHQSRAARLLGMNATTLNSKIKTYNINLRP